MRHGPRGHHAVVNCPSSLWNTREYRARMTRCVPASVHLSTSRKTDTETGRLAFPVAPMGCRLTPTDAQHCVLPLVPHRRPLRQRRHSNARFFAIVERSLRAPEPGWRTHTCPRINAGAASCSKIRSNRWSKLRYYLLTPPPPDKRVACDCRTRTGDSAQDEIQASMLQSIGTFSVDFLTTRPSFQTIRRPRRLRLRAGFGYIAWEAARDRMTGTCRLIRRLSSPAQGAISSVLSPHMPPL